jgi:hypothetical protein
MNKIYQKQKEYQIIIEQMTNIVIYFGKTLSVITEDKTNIFVTCALIQDLYKL